MGIGATCVGVPVGMIFPGLVVVAEAMNASMTLEIMAGNLEDGIVVGVDDGRWMSGGEKMEKRKVEKGQVGSASQANQASASPHPPLPGSGIVRAFVPRTSLLRLTGRSSPLDHLRRRRQRGSSLF